MFVVKAKKEICWDEEEERDRERSWLKMAEKNHHSSSSESDDDGNGTGGTRCRKRVVKKRSQVSLEEVGGRRGDGSETLYETEYPSEYDPTQVQSDPEENSRYTPPRRVVNREAYTTPRVHHHHRQQSSLIIRELDRTPISDPVAPCIDDEIVSGYDSASPEEHNTRQHSSESDTLEYVGLPNLPPRTPSPHPDILCAAPPVSPSLFDEDIPISLRYAEEEQAERKGHVSQPAASPSTSLIKSPTKEMLSNSCHPRTVAHRDNEQAARETITPDSNSQPHHDELGGTETQSNIQGDGEAYSETGCCSCCVENSSTVNNVYSNVTYVTYGQCGHALSMNRLSCFHCCAGQHYDGCYHYPHSHYSHPSQYHSAPYPQYTPPCKTEPTHNLTDPIHHLVDPLFNPPNHVNTLVDPQLNTSIPTVDQALNKRTLDSELCDPSGNNTAPLAKKHCP